MILSTWNFECALQLQSTKTISFHYVRHPTSLFFFFSLFFFNYLEVTHLISPFLGTQRVGEDHPSEYLTNYIGELCVYKKVCSFFAPLSH